MKSQRHDSKLAVGILLLLVALGSSVHAESPTAAQGAEVTLKGSMVCDGACVPDGYAGLYVALLRRRIPAHGDVDEMASCWWEISGDKGMYNVRHAEQDPRYPPGVENARSQRSGRGIIQDVWSIGTHEFITEKADYAGQKFRVIVEVESTAPTAPSKQ